MICIPSESYFNGTAYTKGTFKYEWIFSFSWLLELKLESNLVTQVVVGI